MTVRLAVVGSANLDLTIRVPHLPVPGETVAGSDITRTVGGKGANQALAAARLGARSTLVAAVGDDAFGAEVVASLSGAGLDMQHVRVIPRVPTGVALIQVRPDGENAITISAGANGRLALGDVAAARDVVAAADVLLLQLEVPLPVVAAAVRAANGLVVLNAAPLPGDLTDLVAVLPQVDVLVVNEREAAGLAATGSVPDQDWAATARRLLELGPRNVVITLGPDGAVAAAAAADAVVRVEAWPVDVVDAVGAGDAFCAELAVSLARGSDLATAVRRACAAGALATTAAGAQGGVLDPTLVERLIRQADAPAAGPAGAPLLPAEA